MFQAHSEILSNSKCIVLKASKSFKIVILCFSWREARDKRNQDAEVAQLLEALREASDLVGPGSAECERTSSPHSRRSTFPGGRCVSAIAGTTTATAASAASASAASQRGAKTSNEKLTRSEKLCWIRISYNIMSRNTMSYYVFRNSFGCL